MRAGTEPQKHPALSIEIEHALVAALRPEARRRDVSVARLVYDLLGASPPTDWLPLSLMMIPRRAAVRAGRRSADPQ